MKTKLFTSSILGFSLISLVAVSSSGAEESTAQGGSSSTASSTRPPRLFGGLAGGYSFVKGPEFGKSPNGGHAMVLGELSFDLGAIVMDGGVGWLFNHVKGTQLTGLDFKRDIYGALIELNPRAKFSDHWQLGPMMTAAIGNDLQHSYLQSNAMGALFAGLRGVYEFQTSGPEMRIFAQGLTDLSISSRQVWMTSLGIQFGIDLESAPVSRPQEQQSVSSIDWIKLAQAQASTTPLPFRPSHREYRVARVTRTEPSARKQEVRVTLEPALVHFKTNSAALNTKARAVLNQLGEILSKHPGIWETLQVRGHTDDRGSYEYNLKLSARRSNAVLGALREGGAKDDKIIAEAFSFSRPVEEGDNENAWAKNRRVEIVIKNVTDPDQLEALISKL